MNIVTIVLTLIALCLLLFFLLSKEDKKRKIEANKKHRKYIVSHRRLARTNKPWIYKKVLMYCSVHNLNPSDYGKSESEIMELYNEGMVNYLKSSLEDIYHEPNIHWLIDVARDCSDNNLSINDLLPRGTTIKELLEKSVSEESKRLIQNFNKEFVN